MYCQWVLCGIRYKSLKIGHLRIQLSTTHPKKTFYTAMSLLPMSYMLSEHLRNSLRQGLTCIFFCSELHQSSPKRRITRISSHVLPWDALFLLGGSSAYTCFFSRHALKIQEHTGRSKALWYYRSWHAFEPQESWLLSCLCWPIVWLGLQWSKSDRWLTGLPMRDSVIITRSFIIKVIKQGLSDNCLQQMRYLKLIGYCKHHQTCLSCYRHPNSTD